jgi:hypothetical protein
MAPVCRFFPVLQKTLLRELHRFHNQFVTASVAAEEAIMEFMSAFSLEDKDYVHM